MSEVLQVSVVRHTKNYEAMLEFYRDRVVMSITQTWRHRSLGIDAPDGLRIWYYQDLNGR